MEGHPGEPIGFDHFDLWRCLDFEALHDFLSEHAELHLCEMRSHAAVDPESEGHMMAGVVATRKKANRLVPSGLSIDRNVLDRRPNTALWGATTCHTRRSLTFGRRIVDRDRATKTVTSVATTPMD